MNLMSDGARFRASLRLRIRQWALVWAVIVVAAGPFAVVRWHERREVQQVRAALEASYDPIGQLSIENRKLRTDAQELVRKERILLELSRPRSVPALLGLASRAAAKTGGEMFVREVTFTQYLPGGEASQSRGKMTVEAAGTLTYDISHFVESLKQAPFTEVTILSTEVVSQDGVEQKNYTLECVF